MKFDPISESWRYVHQKRVDSKSAWNLHCFFIPFLHITLWPFQFDVDFVNERPRELPPSLEGILLNERPGRSYEEIGYWYFKPCDKIV